MIVPEGMKLLLDPQDEYTHEPEAASNFNESMYFNAFDKNSATGLWIRIGNRVNEGYAEMTCCVYLLDGKIGFIFARPKIDNNNQMAAGGAKFEVIEPFEKHRVAYEGELLLMERPHEMLDPKLAFANNPKVDCTLEIDFTGVSPMHGGEIVNMDGSRWDLDADKSVFRGHTEQHMAIAGYVTVAGVRHELNGFGFRDKSWGPRHWRSFYYYKWLPMTFNKDFSVLLSYMGQEDGPNVVSGHVVHNGEIDPLIDATIEAVYDGNFFQTGLTATLKTNSREYVVTGTKKALIPLRHLQKNDDGSVSYARITEAMMQYECDGHTGYGMSEFMDLMEGGIPLSVRLERERA